MVTDVQQKVVKIHANRAKALFLAGVAAVFVAVDWLNYFVWPTPEITTQPWIYEEPFKTALFIIVLLLMGAGLLAGLYLTVTPRPLVQLDSEGMVYELYPFVRRSVWWADVSRISAFKDAMSVSPMQRSVMFTLYFTIKPHAVLAYGGKSKLKWRIGQALLPISVEELVQSMQRFHTVTLIDPHSLRRLARKYASSEFGEHGEHRAVSHAHDGEHVDAAKRPLSRRVTRIVVASFVGLSVGLFGIDLLLYYVVGMHGTVLVLLIVLLNPVLGWLLIWRLLRTLLPHPGRREEEESASG